MWNNLKAWIWNDYKPDVEYYIPINNIVIDYEFQLKSPNPRKFKNKEKEFIKNGTLGKILLNKDFVLVDGYCSYLICKKHGMNNIPVYFV